MRSEYKDGAMNFYLTGRIDSNNAEEVSKELEGEIDMIGEMNIAFDAKDLEYISSAGLRVLLRIRKKAGYPVTVRNVSDEIFDIFSVTGFDQMFTVERPMRQISLKGCAKLSSALNGEIFELSEDEMVKVYGKDADLDDVKKERDYAQTAMINGIPTLIPYDVVSCEKGYGIVIEKGGAQSLAQVIANNPDDMEKYAVMFADMMREIHSTEIPEGKLPDIKDRYRGWIDEISDMESARVDIFNQLIDGIEDRETYVHGDINLNSVMVKDGELLLVDMAGSARGHALFDLQSIFASLVAIEKVRKDYCFTTFGIKGDVCVRFWKLFFDRYMEKESTDIGSMNELLLKYFVLKEQVLNLVEEKHRVGGDV